MNSARGPLCLDGEVDLAARIVHKQSQESGHFERVFTPGKGLRAVTVLLAG